MSETIEPGLLDTFRSLNRVQGVILLAALGLQLLDPQGAFPLFAGLYLGCTVLLAILLRFGSRARAPGRLFAALALAVAALSPGLCHAAAILLRLLSGHSGAEAALDPGGLILWLLPTLLLVSSQYPFRIVLLFTLGTAGLDVLFAAILQLLGGALLQGTLEQALARVLIYLIIGYVVTRFSTTQRRIRRNLAEKNAQLVDFAATREQLAVTRERNRMARELHDTLAHSLTALSVQLQAAEVLVQRDPPAAAELLEKLGEETREGTREVRRAMHALRASPLEDLGLTQALRSLAQSAANRAGCMLELRLPEHELACDPIIAQHLYRISEEALRNIVRHAAADSVQLFLENTGGGYRLTITDNGRGFDTPQSAKSSFGLTGIKERASLCGGTAEVSSTPGQGTRITVQTGKLT